jgi:hypothetical protein
MVERTGASVDAKNDQGKMKATYHRGAATFELAAHSATFGAEPKESDVLLQGRIEGTHIFIDYSAHSQ